MISTKKKNSAGIAYHQGKVFIKQKAFKKTILKILNKSVTKI